MCLLWIRRDIFYVQIGPNSVINHWFACINFSNICMWWRWVFGRQWKNHFQNLENANTIQTIIFTPDIIKIPRKSRKTWFLVDNKHSVSSANFCNTEKHRWRWFSLMMFQCHPIEKRRNRNSFVECCAISLNDVRKKNVNIVSSLVDQDLKLFLKTDTRPCFLWKTSPIFGPATFLTQKKHGLCCFYPAPQWSFLCCFLFLFILVFLLCVVFLCFSFCFFVPSQFPLALLLCFHLRGFLTLWKVQKARRGRAPKNGQKFNIG